MDYKPARLSLDIADSGGIPGQTAANGNGSVPAQVTDGRGAPELN